MDFDRRCDILEDKNTVKAKQVNRQKCQDLTGKIQRYQGQAGKIREMCQESDRVVPFVRSEGIPGIFLLRVTPWVYLISLRMLR